MVLVLLPPSEGKTAAHSGRPLDLSALSLPALTPARAAVLDALAALCRDDPAAAAVALGLSEGLRDEIARNARLHVAPAQPAARVYTGVLYEALGVATLDPAAKRWLTRAALVFSGLWGAVRLTDRIPAYRCSISAALPGPGPLGGYWKRVLPPVLGELADGAVVLDLRSSAYQVAWRPAGPAAERTATVRVLHERTVAGRTTRGVVSHFNKATKGRLVGDLARAGARPRSVPALVGALRDLGYTVESGDRAPGRPHQLDVVVTEV